MDIRTVDIVYLHGPHRPERREHMDALISSKGLQGRAFVGVSDQGKKSAVAGLVKLMKERLEGEFRPFIFMEDDCSATKWFRYEIPVPDNADAVYLGVSVWGMHPEREQAIQYIIKERVSDELFRIYNMLSMHAILFLTRAWTQNVLKCFEYAYSNMSGPDYDVPVAYSMSHYNVYALKNPLFYQDAKVGGQEEPTLIQLY